MMDEKELNPVTEPGESPGTEAPHKEPKPHKDKHIEKIKALEAKIEELEAQAVKLKNDYYKAYADAENIKKRNQAELEQSKKYRIQGFAVDILPAIDNLERALATFEDKENPIAKGILMTYNQLIESLRKEGVEEIEALNQPFDPNFHQALLTATVEGVAPHTVIEVLQKGYKLKDRLIRPVLVKVSE